MYRQAIAVASCSLLWGCIVLPIPTSKHTPREYGTRGRIEQSALSFIESGVTTREDVLLRLGEPDVVWHDERFFAYRWITVTGYVFMAGGNSGAAVPMDKDRHDLVIEFNDTGQVLHYQDIRRWGARRHGEPGRLDLAKPIEVPVDLRDEGEPKQSRSARLRLEQQGLVVEQTDEGLPPVRIDAADVTALHCQSKKDVRWQSERFACTLKYRASDGTKAQMRFYASLTVLPTLIDYVRQNCPHAAIK